jgi:molybdopterin molybdotransferase
MPVPEESSVIASMLTVDEALERVLAVFSRLPAETIPMADGLGRVLAEDVRAALDLPPFANSSMDGYAVRAADVANARRDAPVSLAVVADIPAGAAPQVTIGQGQAARIMTGAPMPAGADAVVPVEQSDDAPDGVRGQDRIAAPPPRIVIYAPGAPGDYVRAAGEDVKAGQIVLHEGRVLRAADLGVLAGLGVSRIQVIRLPVVAVLSTGDELLEVDEPLTPGKIRDTNSVTITALVQSLGARALRLGIARDTVTDVETHLRRAADAGADLIISTAGVSVGNFDVVKSVVESLGALGFWKVKMRPGKPLAFGNVQGIPFLGLPGNPVSAMVSFDVFARPAILKMAGKAWQTPLAEAEVASTLHSDGRQSYLRVTLERAGSRLIAHSTGSQSSGVLTSLVYADGLLIVPEGMTDIQAGTRLPVRLFAEYM